MGNILLIKNGTVVTEDKIFAADILCSNGLIDKIDKNICKSSADRIVDASGLLVVPGGIDPHVHISRQYNKQDDFYTGSCAALAGGTTTVIDFSESDAGEDTMEVFRERKANGDRSVVDFTFHFTFTRDYRHELEILDQIKAAGMTSFKVFTCYDNTTLDRGDLEQIFRAIKDIGPVLVHSEAEDVCKKRGEELDREGKTDFRNHAKARPALAEKLCVSDICILAEETGAKACIAHLSTEGGLDILKNRAWAETCPHYLQFTEKNLEAADGALYTMTPPLRTSDDTQALWKGLFDGDIEMFSTDHCAFSKNSKLSCNDWHKMPNGVGGIQQRMIYLFSEGVKKRNMSLNRYVQLTSSNAARFYGLWPKKGTIVEGSDADLTLIDPDKEWTFQSSDIMGNEDYSLYEGMTFKGKISTVISHGDVVYENDRLNVEAGHGKYIKR